MLQHADKAQGFAVAANVKTQCERFEAAGYKRYADSKKSMPFFYQKRIMNSIDSKVNYWINVNYWDLTLEFARAAHWPTFEVDVQFMKQIGTHEVCVHVKFSFSKLFTVEELERTLAELFLAGNFSPESDD